MRQIDTALQAYKSSLPSSDSSSEPSSPPLALIFPQSVGDPSLPIYSSGEDYFTQGPFPASFSPPKHSSSSSGESVYATAGSSLLQEAVNQDEDQDSDKRCSQGV